MTARTSTPLPEISFSLRLETSGGDVEIVPIDLTPFEPTLEQARQIKRLLLTEERKPHLFLALCTFARLNRPDEDWGPIGPVLLDYLDPDGSAAIELVETS